MNRKLITVARNPNAAPKEVTEAIEEVGTAIERAEEAKAQLSYWQKEKELADRDLVASERTLDLALGKFNPRKSPDIRPLTDSEIGEEKSDV